MTTAQQPVELDWVLALLAGRPLPPLESGGRLLPLLHHHRLGGWLRPADLPADIQDKARAWQRAGRMRALQVAATQTRLAAALAEIGVPSLALKGPPLSLMLFGDLRRDSLDVDILVPQRQARAALACLQGLGFVPVTPEDRGGVILSNGPGLPVVELHWRLTQHLGDLDRLDLWRDTVTVSLAGRAVPCPRLEAQLPFLAWHGCGHLWERLTWIADIAAAQNHPDLDWDHCLHLAQQAGLERFTALAVLLGHHWLGAPLPAALTRRRSWLRRAAAALPAITAIQTVPAMGKRDAMFALGPLRYAAWSWGLRRRWRDRLAMLGGCLRPGTADEAVLPRLTRILSGRRRVT